MCGVRGIDGNQLLLDQEVASVVTTAIKKRFDAEGFQVLEGSSAANALFEYPGDQGADAQCQEPRRDHYRHRDCGEGLGHWRGGVVRAGDGEERPLCRRFRNNKDDVVAYFNRELKVASNKTVEAVSASLVAAKPELFNLTAEQNAFPE